MRIVVNDIAASGGGALTVLESFHRHVREHAAGHEWVFLLGSDLLEESAHIRTVVLPGVKRSWLKRLVFDTFSGRRLITSLKPDAVFSLQNTFTYGIRCPQVIYVHQSLPFQQIKKFSLWRRNERLLAIYQFAIGAIIKQSILRANHVIVQTQWMREAIVDQVGIAYDRITSVPPDLDDLSVYKVEGAIDAGAFFYPTSDHIYKNNDCIYKACAILREQGAIDFRVTITIDSEMHVPNVDFIGAIPREQVIERLSRCTLIFPSYIETYGLPLAEARSLGSIVLAADCPYAREVLDGYSNAYFFDPSAPLELALLIGDVMCGHISRSREGRAPAEIVSDQKSGWSRIAEIIGREAGGRFKSDDTSGSSGMG